LWSCCWLLLVLLLLTSGRLTQQLTQAQGPAQGLLVLGLVVLVVLLSCIAAVLTCAGGLAWPVEHKQVREKKCAVVSHAMNGVLLKIAMQGLDSTHTRNSDACMFNGRLRLICCQCKQMPGFQNTRATGLSEIDHRLLV
jgi:hypothetical protein